MLLTILIRTQGKLASLGGGGEGRPEGEAPDLLTRRKRGGRGSQEHGREARKRKQATRLGHREITGDLSLSVEQISDGSGVGFKNKY